MSEKSKLHQSREHWKQKAIDRGNTERAQRKEIRRIKTERNQFKAEAKATRIALAKRSSQADVCIQNKTDIVYLTLSLFLSARIGFRAIARVLTVLGPYLGLLKTPCPQTISNWVTRLSIAKMHTFAQSVGSAVVAVAQQAVWLIDISIGLGSGKILSVLALDIKHHQQKNYAPGLADVQCVASAVSDSWTGEMIADFLRKVIANVGCPAAFLKDGGTDLKKAVGLLNEQGYSYQCIADLSHTVANLFKHEYGDDPLFNTFISACGHVSKKLKQTLLACLAPPKVSTKARFMNLHRLVEWADKLLKQVSPDEKEEKPMRMKLRASLDQLPACEAFIKRFLHDAKPLLACQKILKQKGLNLASYAQCQKLIEVISASSSIRSGFTDWAESQLAIANKLGMNQMGLPISTDAIESLFGVGKRLGMGQVKDANRINAHLPALCGTLTQQDAQNVVNITVAKHTEIIGCVDSLSKQRRDVLPNPENLEALANDHGQHHLILIQTPLSCSEPVSQAVAVGALPPDITLHDSGTISLLPGQVLLGAMSLWGLWLQGAKSRGKYYG